MIFSSIPGGEPPQPRSPEEIDVASTKNDDTVVDSGSLDIGETPAVPVEFAKAKIVIRQEWVRAILAVLFVLLLSLIIVWSFIKTTSWQDTLDLLDRVFPAVAGLLGSVMGFYFATRNSNS
jgi:hypothetical protein